MVALVRYTLQDYMRSYRYVPPVSVFIILIIIFYSNAPNPIMDSFAVTCGFLYCISAWISMSLFNAEDAIQHQITILHAKNAYKFYLSKVISAWSITALLTVFAVVYPIILHKFDKPVLAIHVMLAFTSHITVALLAILMAALFTKPFFARAANSWGMVSLLLVLSFAYSGIKAVLPSLFQPLLWLLPPFDKIFSNLMLGDSIALGLDILLKFTWVYVYCFVLLFLLFSLTGKKKDF